MCVSLQLKFRNSFSITNASVGQTSPFQVKIISSAFSVLLHLELHSLTSDFLPNPVGSGQTFLNQFTCSFESTGAHVWPRGLRNRFRLQNRAHLATSCQLHTDSWKGVKVYGNDRRYPTDDYQERSPGGLITSCAHVLANQLCNTFPKSLVKGFYACARSGK